MSDTATAYVGDIEKYRPDNGKAGIGETRFREQVEYRPPPARIEPVALPQTFDEPLPSLDDLKADRAKMESDRDRRREREYVEIVSRIARGESLPGDVVLAKCEAAGKTNDDYQADIASYRERERLLALVATEAAERSHENDLLADDEAARVEVERLRAACVAARQALDEASAKRQSALSAISWQRAKLAKIAVAKRELVERAEYAQFDGPAALDRVEAVNEARAQSYFAAQKSERAQKRSEQTKERAKSLRIQAGDLCHKQAVARETMRHSQAAMLGEQIRQLQPAIEAADESIVQAEREFIDARKAADEAIAAEKAAVADMLAGGAR